MKSHAIKRSVVSLVCLSISMVAAAFGQVQVPVRGGGAPQEPVPAPRTMDVEMLVPEGTVIPVVITSYLNSRSSQVGDSFFAEVIYPIWVQQRLVIPKGTTVRGRVTEVKRPGRFKGKGRLAIRLDELMLPNGVRRDMVAAFKGIHGPGNETIDRKSETIQGETSKGADTGQIVSQAGQGAIIGAISGGGKGAGIGAGAGAAIGLGSILFTRGRDLVLEPGTQFDLELKQPLRFAYGEIDFTAEQLNSPSRMTSPRPRYDPNQNRNSYPYPRRGIGIPWP